MERPRTYGGELEKVVANRKTGDPIAIGSATFSALKEAAVIRGTFDHFHVSDAKPGVTLGAISTDLGEQGLDNGFNNQETAIPYETSLEALQRKMEIDLQTVQSAVKEDGGMVVNLANHPLTVRDRETYDKYVAPKGIYPYLWYRGWDHSAGIDARAQNSPSTGVDASQAADAVSVVIGSGAAMIGLFANSPYEERKRSPYKESRLTMWDRMMQNSKVKGDIDTARFPPHQFHTLAQYFNWMFGGKTGIHFVFEKNAVINDNYKSSADRLLLVEENPPVLEFLARPEWKAHYFRELSNGKSPHTVTIAPTSQDLELMQFAQFAGARVRFGLDHNTFPLAEFVAACKDTTSFQVEQIFKNHASFVYIEGRDVGANFPDKEMYEAGTDIARSVMIAPSILQAGLIQNLGEAVRFIESFDWCMLGQLREAAIRDGLEGRVGNLTVFDFAQQIVAIAKQGVTPKEAGYLAYPEWVLQTGKNGADRAIEFVINSQQPFPESLGTLILERKAVVK